MLFDVLDHQCFETLEPLRKLPSEGSGASSQLAALTVDSRPKLTALPLDSRPKLMALRLDSRTKLGDDGVDLVVETQIDGE